MDNLGREFAHKSAYRKEKEKLRKKIKTLHAFLKEASIKKGAIYLFYLFRGNLFIPVSRGRSREVGVQKVGARN